MTPLQNYQQLIASGEFVKDPSQKIAVDELEKIYQALLKRINQRKSFFNKFRKYKKPVIGLYLWGGVGIGKTWLMDIFYDCLPANIKLRMHFHRFMRQIHARLKQLRGEKNPLKIIAKDFAKKHMVICFDEFFVSDITNAMLFLLFQHLF